MKNLMSKLLLVIVLLLTSGFIRADVSLIVISKITNPEKSTGVQIGDVLKRSVTFRTSLPQNEIIKRLPTKGTRINEVELIDSRVEKLKGGDNDQFKIELTYQVFSNESTPRLMSLPSETLNISSNEQLVIPVWNFWFSPLVLTNIVNAKTYVQPQVKPNPIDLTQHKLLLKLFLTLLLFGLIGLVYINADAKWLPFIKGDFARAHKKIKLLKKNKLTDDAKLKEALLSLHSAFNKTYGSNLFANDINDFISKNQKFKSLNFQILEFFKISNQILYSNNRQDNNHLLQKLISISKSLRDSERGV